jgi:beta propeller repeat protein
MNRRVFSLGVAVALGACAEDPVRPAPGARVLTPTASPELTGSPFRIDVVTQQVTTNPAPQLDPSIAGDVVVYTDLRHGNLNIYTANLVTGIETQVTAAATTQQLHDVAGNTIVFVDLGTLPIQVWSYDIGTGATAPVAASAFLQSEPTIDGTRVVFETRNTSGVNADVAFVDLSTGAYTVLSSTPENEGRPVVSGDIVVFERAAAPLDPDGDIVVRNLITGIETVVGKGLEPHTNGRSVAWSTGVPGTQDIIVRDLTTGATSTIAFSGAQTRPRLAGEFLTFDDNSPGNPDVVILHLPSGSSRRIGSPSAEFLNDVSGNRIAYTSNEAGNLDIFVAEFSIVFGEVAVAPASVNFGDVPVGNSATQIVTVTNAGDADLYVSSANNAPGSAAAFTIQSVTPAAPVWIGPGDVVDVEVRFAPSVNGAVAGTLRITSNDLGEPAVDVPLAGTGTASSTLAEQVEDLLAFFDATVAAGTLVGDGAGASANRRLSALRNMLVAAGGMIAEAEVGDACAQLQDTLERTDGEPQPPDFVAGDDASELHARLGALLASLSCS